MTGREAVAAALSAAGTTRPTLTEMRDVARDEAARIEVVQAGLIDCGARTGPDEGQIRKLVAWDAIERLADLFLRHEPRARTFFRDLEMQGRRG